MAACLYDPEGGFFATGLLRSTKDGDFLTSPEVSPWFGRMLARFVATEQTRTGADPFLVVEAGAGSGSLLRPLMDVLQSVPPAEGWGDAEERSDDAGGASFSIPTSVPYTIGRPISRAATWTLAAPRKPSWSVTASAV